VAGHTLVGSEGQDVIRVDLVGGVGDGATREVPDNVRAIRFTQAAGAPWYGEHDPDAPPTARVLITTYVDTGQVSTVTGHPIFSPNGHPELVEPKP
jgi:hypothetical protein